MKEEIKKAISLLIVVLIILAAVYIVTEIMNSKSDSSDKKDGKTTTTVQSVNTDATYDNMIMLSRVFNISDSEYKVLFYSNKNKKDSLDAVIKLYDSKKNSVKLYKVNYDEAINNSVLQKEDNKTATSSEELKVKGVTLITIKDGVITSYITNEDDILSALE